MSTVVTVVLIVLGGGGGSDMFITDTSITRVMNCYFLMACVWWDGVY